MRKLRLLLKLVSFYVAFMGIRYCLTYPRLSGEELTALEALAQLKAGQKEGIHLEWIDVGKNSWPVNPGSDPTWHIMRTAGDQVYFYPSTLAKNKAYFEPTLGNENTRIVDHLTDLMLADGIQRMTQDPNLTIFTDFNGNRYARWHQKNGRISAKNEGELDFGYNVGSRTGGWLVSRVFLMRWLFGDWSHHGGGSR